MRENENTGIETDQTRESWRSNPSLDLHEAILDATPDCTKVMTPEGLLIQMSKSGCVALGIPEAQVAGIAWVSLLPASIHDAAEKALARAASGGFARFAGHSEASGNTIYWDNLLTPVFAEDGQVSSIICVSRDITAQTLLERELEASLAREQLIRLEMQHRIKNVFTVVTALLRMSEREALSAGSPHSTASVLTGKLGALARVSETVVARSEADDVEIEELAKAVLSHYGPQCRTLGIKNAVGMELTNTLALVFHELATNSVKHGALSTVEGEVYVDWDVEQDGLSLFWREEKGPVIQGTPVRQGFGTQMIDRIVKSMGGDVARNWHASGLKVAVKIPLRGAV